MLKKYLANMNDDKEWFDAERGIHLQAAPSLQ